MLKCSSFYHQSGLATLLSLSNALWFYKLKTKPNIQPWQELRCENQVLSTKENFWRLSVRLFYHQSGLATLLSLSNALMFYALKTKPNTQHWQELRNENQLLSTKENFWLLSVRFATINPDQILRYRCRARSGFTNLKPNQTFNPDRNLGAKTNYFLRTRTFGV